MPYASQSFRYADIVLAIQAKLIDDLSSSEERVLIVGRRLPIQHSVAEDHIRIRTLQHQPYAEAGAGRHGKPIKRIIAIDIVTRSEVDEMSGDVEALTATNGHFDKEESVLDSLDLWTPLNGSSVKMTIEPIREATVGDDAERPLPGQGFVVSTIYFECLYVSKYTL